MIRVRTKALNWSYSIMQFLPGTAVVMLETLQQRVDGFALIQHSDQMIRFHFRWPDGTVDVSELRVWSWAAFNHNGHYVGGLTDDQVNRAFDAEDS